MKTVTHPNLLIKSLLGIFLLAQIACNGQPQEHTPASVPKQDVDSTRFTLADFYGTSQQLDTQVEAIYNSWTDTQRLAQMIITSAGELGKPQATVRKLVQKGHVGGVIFLKGSISGNRAFIQELNELAAQAGHPALLYSIDAEPSLYNRRVMETQFTIPTTLSLTTDSAVETTVQAIDKELHAMGFHQNYAPVVDISPNNEAIKDRSFGSDPEHVVNRSLAFIRATQKDGLIATAKHFPGHGYVTGDTHKQAVYIDGELREVPVYKPLIEAGVLSIMVAHVTVDNNSTYGTNGLPSSCSRNIVTDLLRDSLGFKGLIVTDAMNMMAAVNTGESAPLLAARAGCDHILMPPDETGLLHQLLEETRKDPAFAQQVEASVKRIIRMKLCAGILHKN